ncbi:hypothetical protein SAMN06265795_10959 [Noviherbaspirillum humi]|uniref:Uncharacterized protein n=1 Tax=Noviherbaspirillum humi TaxID=1688639 RepID=A0A239ID70_9BURK|nr:hypothetical protein [Noviherbaspirillum humi]SNS91590.1 hypothetical protein SAMN06265795_10959 [Noviherbaspirillum humi]
MTNANTQGSQPKGGDAKQVQQDAGQQHDDARTEAEAKSVDGKAGQRQKSSHDNMSDVKADTHEGAGGGAKQQRHH